MYRVIVVNTPTTFERGDKVQWFDRQHRVWVDGEIVNAYLYDLDDDDLHGWWIKDDYDNAIYLYDSQIVSHQEDG